MPKEYVEHRKDGFRIAGTRVSLESVVYAFLRGSSPESIAQSFPVLSLEEVFGAIAYYLANQAEVDQYLHIQDADFASVADQSRESNPLLYKKLAEARPSPTRK
jgi:uncharacterized protein (DUF433 family)